MPTVLQLRGARALSDFRLAKLFPLLQQAQPGIRGLSSEFRHFIELDEAPSPEALRLLGRLLAYGAPASAPQAGDVLYLAVPRIGTLSPWASKATDIARNCGLAGVRRIERGTCYFVRGGERSDAVAA